MTERDWIHEQLRREIAALRFEVGSLKEQNRILGECYTEATAARDALREAMQELEEFMTPDDLDPGGFGPLRGPELEMQPLELRRGRQGGLVQPRHRVGESGRGPWQSSTGDVRRGGVMTEQTKLDAGQIKVVDKWVHDHRGSLISSAFTALRAENAALRERVAELEARLAVLEPQPGDER